MSDNDMNPEDAAAFARGGGESVSGSAGHGSENSRSQIQSGVLDRFFDGSASGPPTRKVQQDYDLDTSVALVLRGILRAAPGDGMPPIGEILLGGLLAFKGRTSGSDDSGESGDIGGGAEGTEGISIE